VGAMPPAFADLRRAVAWAHHSGGAASLAAARVATPPRLWQPRAQSPPSLEAAGGGGEWRWRTNLLAARAHWRGW
jgi:hypothetical protein